jgi:CubicO group peptidase (beta-lactamase class C family)
VRIVLALLIVGLVAGTTCAAETRQALHVPSGTVPVLDGILSGSEWDDALAVPLADGVTLRVKHDGSFLYLGVRSQTPSQLVGNIYVARNGLIEILHASHALGDAMYAQQGEVWTLDRPFIWQCRALGFSSSALEERQAFLVDHGWLATVVNLGETEAMEYQIALDSEPMRMLLRFDIHGKSQEILTWPVDTDVGLEPGPLPQEAAFRPEEWCDVRFEPCRLGEVLEEDVGEVPLLPFTDRFYGFATRVPVGWIEVQPGTFVEGASSSGSPSTVLMLQLVPLLSMEQVADLLAPALGLERFPDACETTAGGTLAWRVYHVENQNAAVAGDLIDVALARGDDGVLVAVLQAPRVEHQVLYEDVFLQAIGAMIQHPQDPAQTQYVYEPPEALDDGWATTSLDAVGMDPETISLLTDRLENGQYGGVSSLVIVKDGFLVHEAYFGGTDRTALQEIYSITKSISSTLIGVAIDKGLIAGVEEPIVTFFPEYAELLSDERKQRITIEHLLTHSSGLDWDEQTYPYEDSRNSEFNMYYEAEDWLAYVLGMPMRDEPGTNYEYNTGAVHLLSAILETATGLAADEFADAYLFGPLKIKDYGWRVDLMGYPRTGATHGGLQMSTRDVAKFGQLYLDDGKWHGEQLVSSAWVKDSLDPWITTPSDTGGMGYLWFLNTFQFRGQSLGTFAARGFGGQTLLVTPSLDLVVAITCAPGRPANTLGLHLAIYRAIRGT